MSDKPEVGMTADEVRALPGRSFLHAENWCGHKREDGRVEWRYRDCTVVLRHDGQLWRAVKVRDAGTAA